MHQGTRLCILVRRNHNTQRQERHTRDKRLGEVEGRRKRRRQSRNGEEGGREKGKGEGKKGTENGELKRGG